MPCAGIDANTTDNRRRDAAWAGTTLRTTHKCAITTKRTNGTDTAQPMSTGTNNGGVQHTLVPCVEEGRVRR